MLKTLNKALVVFTIVIVASAMSIYALPVLADPTRQRDRIQNPDRLQTCDVGPMIQRDRLQVQDQDRLQDQVQDCVQSFDADCERTCDYAHQHRYGGCEECTNQETRMQSHARERVNSSHQGWEMSMNGHGSDRAMNNGR